MFDFTADSKIFLILYTISFTCLLALNSWPMLKPNYSWKGCPCSKAGGWYYIITLFFSLMRQANPYEQVLRTESRCEPLYFLIKRCLNNFCWISARGSLPNICWWGANASYAPRMAIGSGQLPRNGESPADAQLRWFGGTFQSRVTIPTTPLLPKSI